MKFIICLIVVGITVVATEDCDGEKLTQQINECREESGVTDLQIDRMCDHKFDDQPEVKKQLLCMFKNLGLIDANGNILQGNIAKNLGKTNNNKRKVRKIAKKCAKMQKTSPEDTVLELVKCVIEHKQEIEFH